MSKMVRVLHDAWCEITKRCTFTPRAVKTPMIEWLREQEQYANQSAETIRERRQRQGIEDNWRREKRHE